MSRFVPILLSLLILSGCAQVSVNDYADLRPQLVLEEFFSGNLSAHGVVKNRGGKVIRTFNATIKAGWEDGVGTLDEDFIFFARNSFDTRAAKQQIVTAKLPLRCPNQLMHLWQTAKLPLRSGFRGSNIARHQDVA